jgi:hypothetical protein
MKMEAVHFSETSEESFTISCENPANVFNLEKQLP